MIEPYNAVGLIPSFYGIRRRENIKHNIEHLKSLTKAAFWLSNLDIPVRLLAIPEGALMGFNDEVLDIDHADYARTCCIDIPGPETDEIGKLAREWNVFIMAQAKARHKDWKDRFFNIGFIVDPDGKIILKHYKISALLPVERSVSPHDVYDWWIKKYGRTLDAFWPVVDTKIGRLGIMMAMEGNYPENGRGLAMNGAEVVYRASMPASFTENDVFEISNRARAREQHVHRGAEYRQLSSISGRPSFRHRCGRRAVDDCRLPRPTCRQAARHQRLNLRQRRHQYRGITSPPRVGAGNQLAEGHPRRARADNLREADLSEKPVPKENPTKTCRLQERRDRQAGRVNAEARHLEEAVELTATLRGLKRSATGAATSEGRRSDREDGPASPRFPFWPGHLWSFDHDVAPGETALLRMPPGPRNSASRSRPCLSSHCARFAPPGPNGP